MNNQDFLYCYSPKLFNYLKDRGFKYILKARSIKEGQIFTLYYKSKELQEAVGLYENNK